jgi:hypothetical protein
MRDGIKLLLGDDKFAPNNDITLMTMAMTMTTYF